MTRENDLNDEQKRQLDNSKFLAKEEKIMRVCAKKDF